MQFNAVTSANPFGASQISVNFSAGAQRNLPSEPVELPDTQEQLVFARRQIRKLLASLEAINTPLPTSHVVRRGGVGTQAANTASSANLGLTTTVATPTTLSSTEEVNSTSTSFSPFGPSFGGSSTSLPTIGGVYDGDNGTDTLTFQVTGGGVVGVSPVLTLEVRDSQSQLIETLNLNLYQADDQVTLQNGLTLSLSSGTLTFGDSFTVDVFDATGSVVDPTKPFNGSRNDNPNFENGLSVSAGSFEVNGVTISVAIDDSINTVLAKITASSAGVTATFDGGTESVLFTQKTSGSTPTITVGTDTSGFLAATKLNSATAVQGQDALGDADRPLDEVAQFSSVQNGSFLINGTSIAIDVQEDSLNDILVRITASAADVTATLIGSGQRVSITSNEVASSLVLNSNGTGLFSALQITEGTYAPEEGTGVSRKPKDGLSSNQAKEVIQALKDVAEEFNPLFDTKQFGKEAGPFLTKLRQDFQDLLGEIYQTNGPEFRSRFGLNFDFRATANKVLDVSNSGINQSLLLARLQRAPNSVNDLLFGSLTKNDDGLIESLVTLATKTENSLNDRLGPNGRLIDVFA